MKRIIKTIVGLTIGPAGTIRRWGTIERALFICLPLLLGSCRQQPSTPPPTQPVTKKEKTAETVPTKSKTARYLDSLGFVNIATADSTIAIDLMYTRPDNFTGQVLYEDLHEAYLHPEAMESLLKAQRLLQAAHPGHRLIVYDAARPLSVQQKMWDVVKGTPKNIYVSNPAHGGGLHNYGLAVDISIVDPQGTPLPMGTPVDYLGKEAHITHEAQLLQQGKLTEQQHRNRLLLRRVMTEAGFSTLPAEWWHFNRQSRRTAKEKYRVIP